MMPETNPAIAFNKIAILISKVLHPLNLIVLWAFNERIKPTIAIGNATNVKLTIQQIDKETAPKIKLIIDCFFIITPLKPSTQKSEKLSREV